MGDTRSMTLGTFRLYHEFGHLLFLNQSQIVPGLFGTIPKPRKPFKKYVFVGFLGLGFELPDGTEVMTRTICIYKPSLSIQSISGLPYRNDGT